MFRTSQPRTEGPPATAETVNPLEKLETQSGANSILAGTPVDAAAGKLHVVTPSATQTTAAPTSVTALRRRNTFQRGTCGPRGVGGAAIAVCRVATPTCCGSVDTVTYLGTSDLGGSLSGHVLDTPGSIRSGNVHGSPPASPAQFGG